MNFKRAFLTAIAIVMAPSLAMAQSNITIPTTLDVTPDVPQSVVFTATATCNGGTPLVQSAPITDGGNVTFSVLNVPDGTTCGVTLSGIPAGWEANSCSFPAPLSAENVCDLTVTQIAFDFDVDFEVDASVGSETGTVDYTLTCENLGNGVAGGTTADFSDIGSFAIPGDDDETETFSAIGVPYIPVANANPADTKRTTCYVTVDSVSNSAIEVGGCSGTVVEFGDDEASCTLTASVFFEGIPTLSQYGMAIMVLLMLGVGFVGFRRFV